MKVVRQALGDKIALETQLDEATLVAKHVLVIEGTRSTREVHEAIARGRHALRDYPEHVETIEVRVDPASAAALERADARRQRRARLG